ncbi:hypothetical protein SAMN04488028_10159 [Reichenbachiella agariperforans]|uniref:Uncharacterized protein n=2 Tax=Reichenbachiellaceae TaxID=2762302 RepID=A0A1M6J6B3_REIAG|nr:hypothetical protein SAMN04488028_10159 [Reichenbachiella agariperforans]
MFKKVTSKKLNMTKFKHSFTIIGFLLIGTACENRDVNAGDGPNFSEIHENINYHFDHTVIDGVEYHILERDRNNPHEGFGFMALNGKKIRDNQDSIKAYLKTLLELQIIAAAKRQNTTTKEMESHADELFKFYMKSSKTPLDIKREKAAE